MSMRQILFIATVLVLTNSCIFVKTEQKDFAFDRGRFTEIKGNNISSFLYTGYQGNPSYVFEHTRVVECSKDKKLKEIGTLGLLKKMYKSSGKEKAIVDRFEEFAKMNNAIYCADIEQKLNYYDELEDVGAIIYGTRNIEDCALFREYMAQQKVAEAKAK